MGMTGFNMWREAEARKKAESVAVEVKVETPKKEEVKAEVKTETVTPVAPKKGKEPSEK